MNKRKRLNHDVEIEIDLACDSFYSTIAQSGFSKLPVCKYAIGHIYFADKPSGRVEDFITGLPQFFGYCKDYLTRKNFNRFHGQVLELVNAGDTALQSMIKDVYRSPGQLRCHLESGMLEEGVPCKICFKSCRSSDTIDDRCRSSLVSFVQGEVSRGIAMSDIYKCICKNAFKITSCHDSSIQSFEKQLSIERDMFSAYKQSLIGNLDGYTKHLDSVSAQIFFGSDLSLSNVEHLDRLMFCEDFEKSAIEQHISKLPNYKKVTCGSFTVDQLFNEYCSLVLDNHCEPNFLQLGKKYGLVGPKGGTKPSTVSDYAQSVCLNLLLAPKNAAKLEELRPILNVNANSRARYTPHPLVEGLTVPRMPCLKQANYIVDCLRNNGTILLGELMAPFHYQGWDIIDSCYKTIEVNLRKVDFLTIREHSLKTQSTNKYLKGKPDQYYQLMDINDVRKALKKYCLIARDGPTVYSEDYCRGMLKKAERTRHFALWYDHAIILNRSYILFVIYPIYTDCVYESSKMSQRELQKVVEKPYIHAIGVSAATTASEEAFQEFRNEQLLSLRINLTSVDGVEYVDKLKFVIGDGPVRCVETGQNKAGPYRMPTLMERFPFDHLSYHEILSFQHKSFADQTTHANMGNFFSDPNNHGKNLQIEMKDRPIELAKVRNPTKKFNSTSKEKVRSFLYDELCGRQRPPILHMKNPDASPETLCADGTEIGPTEPLHDTKGITVKSLAYLPGPQKADDGVISFISEIISNFHNYDDNSKHEKSAETYLKHLIEIVQKLEIGLYPEGLRCSTCGLVFTMSTESCTKCVFYTYYRALLEVYIFGYKDSTKRDGNSSLLLHNLLFILFNALKEINKIAPDMHVDKVINCMYFINVIFYMGISFELQNPLSYHAGRYEDMFRQIKDLAHRFTNRKHFETSFLLNIVKRYELGKVYKRNYSTKHSTVSKAVTAFHARSPMPTVIISDDFVQKNTQNVLAHICRISNFVLSNDRTRYLFVNEHNSIVFRPTEACCKEKCGGECIPCSSKEFPDFAIHNILNSSHKKILDTKKQLFDSFSDKIVLDGKLSMVEFKKVLGQDTSIVEITQLRETLTSAMVLDSVCLDKINISNERSPPNLNSMIAKINTIPINYDKIKFSKMAMCISKVLDKVPDTVVALDRSSNRLSKLSSQLLVDTTSVNEHYHHLELGYYISRINDAIELLKNYLVSGQIDIERLCPIVDNLIGSPDAPEQLEEHTLVQLLRKKQQHKLIVLELLNTLGLESESHGYFLYRQL